MGERESIGGEIAVGYLTSDTLLEQGARFAPEAGAELHVDAEAVVLLGSDVDGDMDVGAVAGAVSSYAGALEIVDLARLPGEPESVVVENVFHRGVAFVELQSEPSPDLEVGVSVNGRLRATSSWPTDLHERIRRAARVLEAVAQRLRAGDRVITGSIVQTPVAVGDDVSVAFGERSSVRIEIGDTP